MQILIVNTSDIHGGAAIAAFRLMNALNANGESAEMLVRDKFSDNENVIQVGGKLKNKFNFYRERGQIYLKNRFSRENLFDVSIANTGVSITQLPEFKKADIIHLHWMNQGMLLIDEIGKILARAKIVWTCTICGHLQEFVITREYVKIRTRMRLVYYLIRHIWTYQTTDFSKKAKNCPRQITLSLAVTG